MGRQGVPRDSRRRRDNDDASIAAARELAAEAALGDRARSEVIDVTGDLLAAISARSYDLIMAFQMIHDPARPVEALADHCADSASPTPSTWLWTKRSPKPWSRRPTTLSSDSCTRPPRPALLARRASRHPVGSNGHRHAPGRRLAGFAERAGFATVDVLAIDHDLFRLYHLIS